MRCFASKEVLFAAAASFDLDLPDLVSTGDGQNAFVRFSNGKFFRGRARQSDRERQLNRPLSRNHLPSGALYQDFQLLPPARLTSNSASREVRKEPMATLQKEIRKPRHEHSVPWFWPFAAAIEFGEEGMRLYQEFGRSRPLDEEPYLALDPSSRTIECRFLAG
jgi:hypothetical protein